MTKFFPSALTLMLVLASLSLASDSKPKLDRTPLTGEQLEIYRTFLKSYSNGSKSAHLNLANRTAPLDLSEEKQGGQCLKGINLGDEKSAATTYHLFDPKIPLSDTVTLVDPDQQNVLIEKNDPQRTIFKEHKAVGNAVEVAFASGLLTLSEVAFDKTHRYAVMSFSFVCGGLCGHGETIVFEKAGEKWTRSKRPCSSWIS